MAATPAARQPPPRAGQPGIDLAAFDKVDRAMAEARKRDPNLIVAMMAGGKKPVTPEPVAEPAPVAPTPEPDVLTQFEALRDRQADERRERWAEVVDNGAPGQILAALRTAAARVDAARDSRDVDEIGAGASAQTAINRLCGDFAGALDGAARSLNDLARRQIGQRIPWGKRLAREVALRELAAAQELAAASPDAAVAESWLASAKVRDARAGHLRSKSIGAGWVCEGLGTMVFQTIPGRKPLTLADAEKLLADLRRACEI